MITDGVALGICTILAALITTVGGIIIAMLQRNNKQVIRNSEQGRQIHSLVNGELAKERRKNEVLTKQLRILKELGIIADAAVTAPNDIVELQVERRHPDDTD